MSSLKVFLLENKLLIFVTFAVSQVEISPYVVVSPPIQSFSACCKLDFVVNTYPPLRCTSTFLILSLKYKPIKFTSAAGLSNTQSPSKTICPVTSSDERISREFN